MKFKNASLFLANARLLASALGIDSNHMILGGWYLDHDVLHIPVIGEQKEYQLTVQTLDISDAGNIEDLMVNHSLDVSGDE